MQHLRSLIFGRGNLFSGVIALSIVMLIVLGCTCGKDFNLGDSSSNGGNTSSGNSIFGDDDKDSSDVDDTLAKATIKATTAKFANAISTEDFSSLYADTATEFRSKYSEDELKSQFSDFIRQKRQLLPILASRSNGPGIYRRPRNTYRRNGNCPFCQRQVSDKAAAADVQVRVRQAAVEMVAAATRGLRQINFQIA